MNKADAQQLTFSLCFDYGDSHPRECLGRVTNGMRDSFSCDGE
jgi:hypothetical protein